MQKGARLAVEGFDEVLPAAQVGAAWALTRLYEGLSPLILGYLRLQGAVEPEDLTSEVFIGAFRNLASFDGDEHAFRSWLLTIAHRRLLDERRRLGRQPMTVDLDTAPPVHAGDVEQEALANLNDGRVEKMLSVLSAEQRTVLLLRIVGELSIAEVSQAMGKRQGAVKQLQRRGLNVLRQRFEHEV